MKCVSCMYLFCFLVAPTACISILKGLLYNQYKSHKTLILSRRPECYMTLHFWILFGFYHFLSFIPIETYRPLVKFTTILYQSIKLKCAFAIVVCSKKVPVPLLHIAEKSKSIRFSCIFQQPSQHYFCSADAK